MKFRSLLLLGLSIALAMPLSANAQRKMEKLDRGVVAVRTSSTATFVSWRVLGLDAASTTFKLYRSTNGGAASPLNGGAALSVSNFADTSASSANSYSYYVRPVIGGVEQAPSIPFPIAASGPTQYAYRIPLQTWTGYNTHFVWVGDLDGDGEYDFVLDRLPTAAGVSQKLEGYTSKGVRLWVIDLGPNSADSDNIEPTPSAIDVGHWDGVTVYDFDGDGRAEVALRTANGVIFGDGTTLSGLGTNVQAISFISGMTGAERARINVPNDYLSDGPMAAHFGVAYLNGTAPSLIAKLKNRIGSGDFNLMVLGYDFASNNAITQKWKWKRDSTVVADNHQIRTFDLDQNGTDEFCDGGYCLNANGTLRYKVGLNSPNVVHGDRYHIGNFDPNHAGLEGFDIQQDNSNLLLYLTYNASTGATINAHYGSAVEDTARGTVGDIDTSFAGYEYWSFHGYHRIDTGATVNATTPYPNFRIWWDGDLLSETLNDGKVEKFTASTSATTRLFTVGSSSTGNPSGLTSDRGAPMFYGDIMGDWREEIVSLNAAQNELIICTTPTPTTTRLYTLAHNPAYRDSMTIKGYLQSHQPDYYLGNGMSTPANPNISYVPVVLQSERDNSRGGYAQWVSTNTGYTGTGYTDFTVAGGFVQWGRVSGAGGGSRTLTFRYANGSGGALAGSLVVNGVTQAISFPATSNWNTWATATVTVPMTAGATNTIRLQSTAADFAHIDYLAL